MDKYEDEDDTVLTVTLLPTGDFYFDIVEILGDMGEIKHGFFVDPAEVPAVALTMMEIQLQEAQA